MRYVINTHLHQDHTGGNAQMQALGAELIASANARRIMMVRMMNRAKRSRDDIQAMLKTEFGWSDFMMNFGLDGIIAEMQ